MEFVLIAALSDWLDAGWWWSVLQVVLGLGAVIFVHELGHFLAAKACGVKAEKFYVGFDAFDIKIGDRVLVPRRLVHFQWGETEYGVGILPLGGYVKMLGQDDNPSRMAEERERSLGGTGGGQTKLDPRSYMAKSVPQRMLIISAGVVMNLIFAVIFATLAFRSGVLYEPPAVGTTIPGSPAWQNRLDGARVNNINGTPTNDPNRYFTFNHLRERIVLDADEGPLDLEIVRPDAPGPERLSILAEPNLIGIKGGEELRSLGIEPQVGTVLADPPVLEGQAAALADPPLEAGDRIVQINDQLVVDGFDMRRIFASYSDREVTIKVQRGGDYGTLKDIRLPPNPQRGIGLQMETGPIRAVRKESPAARAGLKSLDRIVSIDGEPVGDPFTLPQRLLVAARKGRGVELGIVRAGIETRDAEPEIVSIEPEIPEFPFLSDPRFGITLEALGINLLVTNRVAGVESADSTLQPGDEVLAVRFVLNESQSRLSRFAPLGNEIDLTKESSQWPAVDAVAQLLDPGTVAKVTYQRDQRIETAELLVRDLPGSFRETRGIATMIARESYQNAGLWIAIQNGFRQTADDATRVLKFMRKLIRGELSVKHLGGPGTIAVVATSEASQGTSRLLLFLTLLSANLAIINFLPIPVLDGGHMVFLAYEGIFRRPVSERLQVALSIAGMVFLIALMATVIGLDIWRLT